jgi:hypothetical protein
MIVITRVVLYIIPQSGKALIFFSNSIYLFSNFPTESNRIVCGVKSRDSTACRGFLGTRPAGRVSVSGYMGIHNKRRSAPASCLSLKERVASGKKKWEKKCKSRQAERWIEKHKVFETFL